MHMNIIISVSTIKITNQYVVNSIAMYIATDSGCVLQDIYIYYIVNYHIFEQIVNKHGYLIIYVWVTKHRLV